MCALCPDCPFKHCTQTLLGPAEEVVKGEICTGICESVGVSWEIGFDLNFLLGLLMVSIVVLCGVWQAMDVFAEVTVSEK